jgi:hypothetical protein
MNAIAQPSEIARPVVRTLWSTAKSTRNLWDHYTFAIALFYTFEESNRALGFLEGFISFYRDLAKKFYDLVHVSNHILATGDLIDGQPAAVTVRDVVTITVVSLLIAGGTALVRYLRMRSIWSDLRRQGQAAVSEYRRLRDEREGAGSAVGGGALAGLLVAGPIGAILGGVFGVVSAINSGARVNAAERDAHKKEAELKVEIQKDLRELRWAALRRFSFCLLVGVLLVLVHLHHVGLQTRFEHWHGWVVEHGKSMVASLRHLLRLPPRAV